MKAGVGFAANNDGFSSGESVTESALLSAPISGPDLVLAFYAGSLDRDSFFKGIQKTIPGVPIVYGSTIGVITNKYLSCSGITIAPLLNSSRGLDWTGALLVFA